MLQHQFFQAQHLKIYLPIFVVAYLMSACVKEESAQLRNTLVIDTSLQPYFDLFEAEGQARGQNIDMVAAQIAGEIINIEEDKVVGQCSSFTNSDRKVLRIDKAYWEQVSNLEREFVVFHELGHCYLGRGHLNKKDNLGNCNSMMHSGLNGCHFKYTTTSRTAYLDELFYSE